MQRNPQRPDFTTPRPAVFLDRDGTLIEDVGVIRGIDQVALFSDTVDALRLLQEKYLLFVISNQSGIAAGEVTEGEVSRVNQRLDGILRAAGIAIREWYVCPHQREDGCACMKPGSEFVLRAQRDYRLDLGRSFVIGDHPHDTVTGNEHGVFGLYLLTGHGGRHLAELPIEKPVFHRIRDAAEWILSHPDPEKDLAREIEEGAAAIRAGGVAAFPTETVYGLGADVFQPDAVKKIFEIKGRPHYNPLIAHIADTEQLKHLATEVPEKAWRLIEAFWPGPLTLVLPKRTEVPDIVTGGHKTVAVRMPAHRIALEIIRQCGSPLAAPSANRFTCTSPTTARHVRDQLGDQCPVIVDGGACRVGVESTVLSFAGPVPEVLRPGGLAVEAIERLIGPVNVRAAAPENTSDMTSPGMMPNHYAPATKLTAYARIPASYASRPDIGLLLFKTPDITYAGAVEVLSKSGDTREAAANFFAALRRLDALGLREIIAEYAPEEWLGHAINNRLSKAAMGRIVHEK